MEEETAKIVLAFGKYTSKELSYLREAYPLTHDQAGYAVMDERLYVYVLAQDRTLTCNSEVLFCSKEDLPLHINSSLIGAAKQVYKWRLEIGK